jgi:hypothetical protein
MFDGGKITKWKQGDFEFSIRQMNPFKAMKVLGDLQKLIIPAIGGSVSALKDSSQNAEIVAAIGGALSTVANSLDGDKLEQACKLLLNVEYIAVKEKGAKDFAYVSEEDLEAIYTGRPWDMLALCAKIFEVNFLDFSKSSTVPIGVQKALRDIIGEVKVTFQGALGNTSAE